VTRKEWPDCRSLSGASQKYLADALKARRQQQRREAARVAAEAKRRREQESAGAKQAEERSLQAAWDALPPLEQAAVRAAVLAGRGSSPAPEAFVRRLCLEEMGRGVGG